MFARFNHLGISLGINGTKTAIDRIRKSYDNEVLKWKTTIADYLLLPSDISSSQTISYDAEVSDQTQSLMSIGSSPMNSRPTSPNVAAQEHSPMHIEVNQELVTEEADSSSSNTIHQGMLINNCDKGSNYLVFYVIKKK